MSEQNLASILDSMEGIYREHRRNGNVSSLFQSILRLTLQFIDVTTHLTTLIIDGIAAHSSLLDSYVVLYAAFVSSLHKIIGVEFGTKSASTIPLVLTLFPSRQLCSKYYIILREAFLDGEDITDGDARCGWWQGVLEFDRPVVGTLQLPGHFFSARL